MLYDEIKQFSDLFESLVYCKVENDVVSICDSICFNDIPLGNVNKDYFVDKNLKEVNILDYITSLKYYLHYQPLDYDLFNRYFDLNNEVLEVLKNNEVNVYEVNIIMGGLLKDMGGYLEITSEECYHLNRLSSHKVQLETPHNLFENDVLITTSSYYPNYLFILD